MKRKNGSATHAALTFERESLLKSHHQSVYRGESKKSPSVWPIYSLVSTVALACYLNGLNGDFVHDDIPAVTLNKDVLGINPISHVFKNDFWGTPMADLASHKSYRPLTVLTFRANYLCFGLQPVWFHTTNIILHAAASVLFTRVGLCVAGLKHSFATLAGLLFAAHPIHTEAVTGIVGRADVLASVFFLFSLLSYHGNLDGKCYIWNSIFMGGLSMLSKETGVSVFILNLGYDFYRQWPNIKKTLAEAKWNHETRQFICRAAKVLMSLGVLLTIRLALLQGSLPRFSQQDNPAAFHPQFTVRLLTFCYLAAFNWWLLLCPATLSHDWQMGSVPLVTSVYDSRNLVTCFFLGAAVLLALKSLSDFEAQRHAPVVLGLMMLVFPFLPATNLLVTVGFVIAERVLYIPSMGCILLVVYGIQVLWNSYSKHRQTVLCLIVLLLTTSCLRTIVRNKDWRSRESLLRAGLATLPQNAKMHYNYANFLKDSARPELAKSHYRNALKLWPAYASAHNNLGTLLSDEKEAEQHFLSAIRYSADHVNAHYNLGQLYRRQNQTSRAEHILNRCIKIEPKFTMAYIELARLKGPKERSVGKLLWKVVELNKNNPYYVTMYAHWLLDKGYHFDALEFYWKALKISSTYEEAISGVLKILRKFGQSSRLFQIITRWQSILRIKRGELPLSPHVYLQEWRLKNELSTKAKAYDDCPSALFVKHCIASATKTTNFYKEENSSNKWVASRKYKTNSSVKYEPLMDKQCKAHQAGLERQRAPHLMVHHIFNKV